MDFFGARHFGELAVFHFNAHGFQTSELAFFADEFFGGNGELAFEHAFLCAFVMAGTGAHFQRPIRPHQRFVFLLGRLGHDLELGHAGGTVAVGGAHTVAAGVAAANHDDVFAVRTQLVFELVARIHLVLLGQKLHSEMHATQFTPRNGQVARDFRAAREEHRVEFFFQLIGADAFFGPVGDLAVFGPVAHHHAGFEDHALGLHLIHAAVDVAFLHFEVGDAIAQQTTHAVILFEHRHRMTHTGQLLGCRQTGRTGADHGHFFARLDSGWLRLDPTLGPSPVDDGVFNRLDAHRVVVHIQGARCFAGCGANATGELGEVVGAVQNRQGVVPLVGEHQIVEVGDDVVDGAAAVAKRRAAVHAASALRLGLLGRQANDELFVMLQTLRHGLVALVDALKLHEAGDFSHDVYSLLSA